MTLRHVSVTALRQEGAFQLTIIVQSNKDAQDRCLKLPPEDSGGDAASEFRRLCSCLAMALSSARV